MHFHPAATHLTAETKTKTEAEAKQFNKYFTPPKVLNVTTTLLIPLVPTLTVRHPLVQTFAYDWHAMHVWVLLEQLDTAHGGDRSMTCEDNGQLLAYGSHFDSQGHLQSKDEVHPEHWVDANRKWHIVPTYHLV
jgi:hypothetical protein